MTWKRKPNPERDARIYEDYKAGAKYSEMADYYKLSIQRLKMIVIQERNREFFRIAGRLKDYDELPNDIKKLYKIENKDLNDSHQEESIK